MAGRSRSGQDIPLKEIGEGDKGETILSRRRACLLGVYLTGVHLAGVYLTGVYLTGVYLSAGNRNSAALSPFWEFAVHQGCTVKSVWALLSVLNRPYFGCDLPVRRGSATQR
jgi:hypothetical protein